MKSINFKQLHDYNLNIFLRIETSGYPMIARNRGQVRFIYEIEFQKERIGFNYVKDKYSHTTLYYPRVPQFDSAQFYYISPYSLLIVIFRGNLIWS